MSVPPLIHPPTMPTMVSRLPKLGSRPMSYTPTCSSQMGSVPAGTATSATSTDAPLTNGCHQPPSTAPAVGLKGALTGVSSGNKYSGFIRIPLHWKKGKGGTEDKAADRESSGKEMRAERPRQNNSSDPLQQIPPPPQLQQQSPLAMQRTLKKPSSPSSAQGRSFGFAMTSSQSGPKTAPASKSGTKPGKTAPSLPNGAKPNLNGLAGTTQWMGVNGPLRLPLSASHSSGLGGSKPGSRSSSPLLRNQPTGRSQSSDSLGTVGASGPSVPLSDKDRLRSRSLNQVRGRPSSMHAQVCTSPSSPLHRSPTITRSYSLNRAAERVSKELTSSSSKGLPRAPVARSPLARHAPRAEGVGEGTGVGNYGFGGVKIPSSGAPSKPVASIPSLLPALNLKKPLLPSQGSSAKASTFGYKYSSRQSLLKQPCPLRATPEIVPGSKQEVDEGLAGRKNSLETPPVTPSTTDTNSPDSTPEAPETEAISAEPVSQGDVSVLGETLEDMSLSSTSSLERNDTSQEYMDDFDNLETPTKENEFPTKTATGLQSFLLAETMDLACMRFRDDQGDYHLSSLSPRRRSSQQDYHEQGGSSLDLSPSDSCGSGGTYMWDEEGLEPLGGASTITKANTISTTHHIGSYDSDLDSIDILNNLDSCDLEDDDLMLDADLVEDASIHSDGDGISNMAQWRRRQLCWGTQDVHNDNSEFQSYQLTEDSGNQKADRDLLLGLSPLRSPGTDAGIGSSLGLDVEELVDDCSAVRAELEHLQRLLLQQEEGDEEEDVDDTLTTDTLLSPDSPEDSQTSVEERLNKQIVELLQEVQQLREEVTSRDRTIAQLTQKLSVPMVSSTRTERSPHHCTKASQTMWSEHPASLTCFSLQGFPSVPFLSPPWQYQRSRPYRGKQRPCVPHLGTQTSDTTPPLRPEAPGQTD